MITQSSYPPPPPVILHMTTLFILLVSSKVQEFIIADLYLSTNSICIYAIELQGVVISIQAFCLLSSDTSQTCTNLIHVMSMAGQEMCGLVCWSIQFLHTPQKKKEKLNVLHPYTPQFVKHVSNAVSFEPLQ